MTFIVCVQALAEENPALFQEALRDAIEEATKLKKEANKFIKENLVNDPFTYNFFETESSKKCCPSQGMDEKVHETKGCVKNMTPPIPQSASTQKTAAQKENADQILVFVSFSMPEASLKNLAQEAQRVSTQRVSAQQHNVVLVMRGLYRDSFVKTARKIQELGIAVDIHPELFEAHHVTSVPTFVWLEDGKAIHSLKGNVTLDFAMEVFEKEGRQSKETTYKETP
jgi:conjugal transfer pilus assembly protein TrbC